MTPPTAKQVADELVKAGIKAVFEAEPNDVEDGSINLPDNYHVQVGFFYMSLNREEENGEAVVFGEERHSIAELLVDINNVPSLRA